MLDLVLVLKENVSEGREQGRFSVRKIVQARGHVTVSILHCLYLPMAARALLGISRVAGRWLGTIRVIARAVPLCPSMARCCTLLPSWSRATAN